MPAERYRLCMRLPAALIVAQFTSLFSVARRAADDDLDIDEGLGAVCSRFG